MLRSKDTWGECNGKIRRKLFGKFYHKKKKKRKLQTSYILSSHFGPLSGYQRLSAPTGTLTEMRSACENHFTLKVLTVQILGN